jgi:hypothetical protein
MTITLTREEAQQILWALDPANYSEPNEFLTWPAIADIIRARLSAPEPVMCQHKRYVYDDKDQTGHCYDCNQEGRMQFVAYNEAALAKATGEQQ